MIKHFLISEREKNKVLKDMLKAYSEASETLGREIDYYREKYSYEGKDGLYIDLEAILNKTDRLENYQEWKYYKENYPKYFYAGKKAQRMAVKDPKTVREALINKTMNRSIDAGELTYKAGEALFSKIYRETYKSIRKDFGIKGVLVDIDPKQLQKTIESKWIGDKSFSQRLWKDTHDIARKTFETIEEAIMSGKDPDWIKGVLMGEFQGQPKHVINRLVNTEMKRINTEASFDALKDLDTSKYEISAILDKRTSAICTEMDGKKFDMKDFKIGYNAPPFHPNCRSIILPAD